MFLLFDAPMIPKMMPKANANNKAKNDTRRVVPNPSAKTFQSLNSASHLNKANGPGTI